MSHFELFKKKYFRNFYMHFVIFYIVKSLNLQWVIIEISEHQHPAPLTKFLVWAKVCNWPGKSAFKINKNKAGQRKEMVIKSNGFYTDISIRWYLISSSKKYNEDNYDEVTTQLSWGWYVVLVVVDIVVVVLTFLAVHIGFIYVQ